MKKFDLICYGIILPIIFSTIAYMGFGSKYLDFSHFQKFPDFFYQDLFKYRFLSRELLMILFDCINPYLEFLRNYPMFSGPMNTLGSNFFFTVFIYNTVFYVLFCFILFKLINKSSVKNQKYLYLLYLLIILIVAISQFVITPYDNASIFLLLCSIWVMFKLANNFSYKYNILLACLVVISTFNRESSALILSFYATIILNDSVFNIFKKDTIIRLIKHLFLPVTSFIATYFLLRINTEIQSTIIDAPYWIWNFEIKNILGLLFYLILTHFSLYLANTPQEKQNVRNFILFSAPYLFIIAYAGIFWEIRLFIPLLIGQFILAHYKSFIKHEK